MTSRKSVRILLVGDHGVGKTSLVSTLLKEQFVETVEEVMPEVIIPPHITLVMTHIIDTSSRPEKREILENEIKKANVICCVYAVNKPETFENVTKFWLPFIRRLGVNVPIVLVGNKIDCRERGSRSLEDDVTPIMAEWKEIESCVECSAKNCTNISEVFNFAQKAVLLPTAPLYDGRTHDLKPKCQLALKRIFVLTDQDQDGLLNDDELNQFQVECFNSPLQSVEIQGIKKTISDQEPEGVKNNGITEKGFLFLHKSFIQRGRLETTWQVLRQFGYGNSLELLDEFLSPKMLVSSSQSVELSLLGYKFFTEIFEKFDKDKDRALSEEEMNNLFQTAPGKPWDGEDVALTTVTNKIGHVTLKGFLAQWAMLTLLDYKTTLKYLAYLGFKGDTTAALVVTPKRKDDRKAKKVSRTVLNCFVIGKKGSGKTSILRKHIGGGFREKLPTTTNSYSVVNTVEINGTENYLVMQEFGEGKADQVLDKKMPSADVICFVYDSSDMKSFAYVATLATKYRQEISSIPCCFVANKSDLDLVEQKYDVQPEEFCKQLGIVAPISYSSKQTQYIADLHSLIATFALNPEKSMPDSQNKSSGPPRYLIVGGIVVGLVLGGLALYYGLRSSSSPPASPAAPSSSLNSTINASYASNSKTYTTVVPISKTK